MPTGASEDDTRAELTAFQVKVATMFFALPESRGCPLATHLEA